ncbi:carotenoid oxygenase family protein [Glacieibacterium frigidum]|uniref:Dioxygenase n=1 Tax=Glacieibacterium frigidum TaxID=2593303 RepID=A0A552U738_9SPHN|nr:carotenoid oxygenase family protein [Glacieibacterium frigidum]TRW14033.1 carotenoid oxygenase [Glacieibacterium frigidum]
MLNRRTFLSHAGLATAALAIPEALRAGSGPADWRLALADVPGDIATRRLRRVHGRAPAALKGTLYRNGPARFRRGGSASGHWFDGDGMIRAWEIDDGDARLAARFVDTPKRRLEEARGAMVVPGFGTPAGPDVPVSSSDDTNAANTSVMMAGGKLLALWEAGSATEVDPRTLATLGQKSFSPELKHMPFLAHPRIEPDGRIWNLGLSGRSALVWRLSASGALEASQIVPLPRASYMHDFTATARHLVIVLQPWLQDRMGLPYVDSLTWRPERGTQVMVIDKADLTRSRIFELPAFAFFHLGDAWEEADGTIRFDGCLEADPSFGSTAARAMVAGVHIDTPHPALTMIALHPGGRATLTSSGIMAEFPRCDPRQAGLPRTRTVHVGGYIKGAPFAHAVGVWDWAKERDDAYDFGARQLVEEFVPHDRWLVGTTINLDARATELHVLDAANVARGPLVTWRANVALPYGFHGNFVSA